MLTVDLGIEYLFAKLILTCVSKCKQKLHSSPYCFEVDLKIVKNDQSSWTMKHGKGYVGQVPIKNLEWLENK